MRNHPRCRAALRVAILGSIVMGIALFSGCTTPAVQVASPGATTPTAAASPTAAVTPTPVSATRQDLARLGCVCHIQGEEGAPPVSQVAALPASTIQQTVRQGRGVMPAWSTQNLSDLWLAAIIDGLKSVQQGTPTVATSLLE